MRTPVQPVGGRPITHPQRSRQAGARAVVSCLIAGLASMGITCAPSGGPGPSPLAVSIDEGAQRIVGVGETVTFSAAAQGGAAPYLFRWSQERGPAALSETTSLTETAITTEPLVEQGEYAFRVVATDALGAREESWVILRVGPAGACDSDFCVLIDGPDMVSFGEGAEFSAFVGSFEEATLTWSVLSGSVELSDLTGETTTFAADTVQRVQIQVEARSPSGEVATDVHPLDVAPRITVDDLHLVRMGESAAVAVFVEPEDLSLSFAWSVASGSADLTGATTDEVQVAPTALGTVRVRLTVIAEPEGGGESDPIAVSGEAFVVAVQTFDPQVVLMTELGNLTVELDAEASPRTTANFLRYVDEGFYDGITIHRYSCVRDFQTLECREPFVIQGGGYEITNAGLTFKEPTHGAILGEPDNGLSNTLNTISMALFGNDPDSAQTQFFFNLSDDNAGLDGTFTAFGRVVSGGEVLDQIMLLETREDSITAGRDELLVDPVIVLSADRAGAN